MYESLKAAFPAERYHSGVSLESVEQIGDKVTAWFADGQRMEADLLIGADGLRSTVRSQFLPELKPYYPGYIAWRCLANEGELSASTQALLSDRYAVCVAPGEQGIGYPVPGPDHSMEPGKRQFNVVWYHPVREAEELPRLMTDDAGRYHANGIPPSLIRAEVREEMMRLAEQVLAPQFAEAIGRSKLIFFQPIVDLESPRLVFGRVVVIGDAAFVARPHVAMGVPKAAGDALALVKASTGGTDFVRSACLRSGTPARQPEHRSPRPLPGRLHGSPAQIGRGAPARRRDPRAGARDDGDRDADGLFPATCLIESVPPGTQPHPMRSRYGSERSQEVEHVLLILLGQPIELRDHRIGFGGGLRSGAGALVLLNRDQQVGSPAVVKEEDALPESP